jgi:hypothetical protein
MGKFIPETLRSSIRKSETLSRTLRAQLKERRTLANNQIVLVVEKFHHGQKADCAWEVGRMTAITANPSPNSPHRSA